MSIFTNRKNKITLSDYNYRQDIDNRLFLAELSILEVDVLREIINGSLKTPIAHLSDNLNIGSKEINVILEKLSKSRLFKVQGDWIFVDKEMRKYYEAQIIKFDDDFHPDLEYLQGLLSKVPIHSLPIWYAIPRNSDNIFHSIVEKFMATPKTYERYLQDLNFENPILTSILSEVFTAQDLKVCARKLIKKLNIPREEFEEHMLFLEFSLVCCISYNRNKDLWEEVVTPFHEWRELQLLMQNTNPQTIKDVQNIKRSYNEEFGFLNEMNSFLKVLLKKGISLKEISPKLVDTSVLLKIAQVDKGKISFTTYTEEWLEKTFHEQALFLYRKTLNHLLSHEQYNSFSEKDLREVEKNLKRLPLKNHWVYFDDFIKGCFAAVGSALPVQLQNKGKRWRYSIPKYNENELNFIQLVSCEYLMQSGMIDIGQHDGKLCLCLTSFGRQSLG